MRIVMFYHSLISDWSHGNAHFLRGIVRELMRREHDVKVYEPADGWSLQNLTRDQDERAVEAFYQAYPGMRSMQYELATLDLDEALDGADLVLVHDWNEPELVRRLGRHRAARGDYILLFHDTRHQQLSGGEEDAGFDLAGFDGVLACGEVVRQRYAVAGWSGSAWTWHEAADVELFRPLPEIEKTGDLIWIGNWCDDERGEALRSFLFEPVAELGLSATIQGVRYPDHVLKALVELGIDYAGWLPNYRVPETLARYRLTVHVPRRACVESLPGIPTIRVFEALACGIPLVSAPWDDSEGLFRSGMDYLVAHSGEQMRAHLRDLLNDADMAAELARHGRETILSRHTCAHRVDQLLAIHAALDGTPLAREQLA